MTQGVRHVQYFGRFFGTELHKHVCPSVPRNLNIRRN